MRYCLAHPEGIANRQHQIAHPHFLAVSQRDGGEVVGVNLDNREVTLGIKSNHYGLERAPVRQCHCHLFCSVDKMAVGQDVAVFGHNHPGPKSALYQQARTFSGQLSESVSPQRFLYPACPVGNTVGRERSDNSYHGRCDLCDRQREACETAI